jgi:hypothetical protein
MGGIRELQVGTYGIFGIKECGEEGIRGSEVGWGNRE